MIASYLQIIERTEFEFKDEIEATRLRPFGEKAKAVNASRRRKRRFVSMSKWLLWKRSIVEIFTWKFSFKYFAILWNTLVKSKKEGFPPPPTLNKMYHTDRSESGIDLLI